MFATSVLCSMDVGNMFVHFLLMVVCQSHAIYGAVLCLRVFVVVLLDFLAGHLVVSLLLLVSYTGCCLIAVLCLCSCVCVVQ